MGELCRSCQAPVRFVRMVPSGRYNPLNPEPREDGNVRILADGRGQALTKVALEQARAEGVPLYLSHFANCPQRGAWRQQTLEVSTP